MNYYSPLPSDSPAIEQVEPDFLEHDVLVVLEQVQQMNILAVAEYIQLNCY